MKRLPLILLTVACGAIAYGAGKMTCCSSSCKSMKVSRKADHTIDDIFLARKSSYVLSGESLTDAELKSLFEAARWAPSAYNGQPTRFIYATRDSQDWQKFMNLMVDFNKSWAGNAGALVVVVSKNSFDYNGQPSPTHTFDAGAAWQNLALQATAQGLIAHGMSGFDYAQAKEVLHIPDGYTVEAMVAIGKPGAVESAPEQLQELEKRAMKAERKAVEDIAFQGSFKQ